MVIQQSLIDIEQNLGKLESARSQIEKVSEKSEILISSIADAIKSIETIKSSFDEDENYLKNSVDDTINEFKSAIENVTKTVISNASSTAEEQSTSFNNSLKKFDDSLKKGLENTLSKTGEIYAKQELIISKNLDEVKVIFEKASKEIEGQGKSFSESHEKISSATIKTLQEFQNQLEEVQKSIEKFNLKESLENISLDIKNLNEVIKSNHKEITDLMEGLKNENKKVKLEHQEAAKKQMKIMIAGFIVVIGAVLASNFIVIYLTR
jgi:hypothetical protein